MYINKQMKKFLIEIEFKMMLRLQKTLKDFQKKNIYRINLRNNNLRKDAIAGF